MSLRHELCKILTDALRYAGPEEAYSAADALVRHGGPAHRDAAIGALTRLAMADDTKMAIRAACRLLSLDDTARPAADAPTMAHSDVIRILGGSSL